MMNGWLVSSRYQTENGKHAFVFDGRRLYFKLYKGTHFLVFNWRIALQKSEEKKDLKYATMGQKRYTNKPRVINDIHRENETNLLTLPSSKHPLPQQQQYSISAYKEMRFVKKTQKTHNLYSFYRFLTFKSLQQNYRQLYFP